MNEVDSSRLVISREHDVNNSKSVNNISTLNNISHINNLSAFSNGRAKIGLENRYENLKYIEQERMLKIHSN